MFSNTLASSWDERSRCGLTVVTSFGLQALVVGALLLSPLLRPMVLPSLRPLSTPVSLGQPLAEAPVPAGRSGVNTPTNTAVPSDPMQPVFRQPSQDPRTLPEAGDDGPPQVAGAGSSIPGAVSGDPNGILSSTGADRPIMPVAPVPAAAAPLRISHMNEGDLIRKVLPAYPALARSARIQGTVLLQAVISKQGTIENLRVLSGHPMLVPPAIDAVRQWRYRPYVLNNDPVEVETQITVTFSLAGN